MFKIVDINRVPTALEGKEEQILASVDGHDHTISVNDIRSWLRTEYGANYDMVEDTVIQTVQTHNRILLGAVGVLIVLLIFYFVYRLYRIFGDILERRNIAKIVRKKAE